MQLNQLKENGAFKKKKNRKSGKLLNPDCSWNLHFSEEVQQAIKMIK
jgi:hypothetical protein